MFLQMGDIASQEQQALTFQTEIMGELERITAFYEELRDRLYGLDELQSQSAGGPSEEAEPGQIAPFLARSGDIILTHQTSDPPPGWLLCNGTEVSKQTYWNLYRVIGHTYGAPSTANAFKLPTLTDIRYFVDNEQLQDFIAHGLRYLIRT